MKEIQTKVVYVPCSDPLEKRIVVDDWTSEVQTHLLCGHDVLLRAPRQSEIISFKKILEHTDIDCEMRRDATQRWNVEKLAEVVYDPSRKHDTFHCMPGLDNVSVHYTQCRVRQNHWFYHGNSIVQPIPNGLIIDSVDVFGNIHTSLKSGETDWSAITAFRIMRQQDGYIYSWQ